MSVHLYQFTYISSLMSVHLYKFTYISSFISVHLYQFTYISSLIFHSIRSDVYALISNCVSRLRQRTKTRKCRRYLSTGIRLRVVWFYKETSALIGDFVFTKFYIFLTVHLRIILVGHQLDAQFLSWYVYLNPLHVSSNPVLFLRRTIVLIQLLVQLLCVSGRPVYRTATNTEWLYQMLY